MYGTQILPLLLDKVDCLLKCFPNQKGGFQFFLKTHIYNLKKENVLANSNVFQKFRGYLNVKTRKSFADEYLPTKEKALPQ